MNRYKAISETEFVKFPSQDLTEQELHVLNNGTEQEVSDLKVELKQRFAPVPLEGAELAEVETIYYAHKPQLEDGDVYTLLSFEITLDGGIEGKLLGAYNYKLNKQIFNLIFN
jgi:hypothetical protein